MFLEGKIDDCHLSEAWFASYEVLILLPRGELCFSIAQLDHAIGDF